jgi:two-component system phosphate regulon response regulator PhoB
MQKILIVNDDVRLIHTLDAAFRSAGFGVTTASDGSDGLTKALTEAISLVVLDIDLPEISGFEVCRQLKKLPSTVHVPVMILTNRGSEEDRLRGLEAGAEDYVTRPFSVREFVLRATRAIRRTAQQVKARAKLRVGDFVLDEMRHELRVRGKTVPLTALEFRLFTLLMENSGLVLERDRLLDRVWGYSVGVTTRTVDTHIMRLRTKLGHDGTAIETVRGVGYRLKGDEAPLDLPPLEIDQEELCLAVV